jgi:hypothetical protein
VPDKSYSLSRAIRNVLSRGMATGSELEYHLEEERSREAIPALKTIFSATVYGGQVLHVPLEAFRQVAVGGATGGASLVETRLERVTDLLQWSTCMRAGAEMLTNLKENVGLARTSKLGEPQWVPEIGFSPATEPEFQLVSLGPARRLSGMIVASRQLLMSASPGLDQYLIDGLSRACSNQLDRVALYGAPGGNTPTGISGTPGIHRLPLDWNDPGIDEFLEAERLVEIEDVGLGTFHFIAHPDGKRILRATPWAGAAAGDRSIWELITGPLSSAVIRDRGDIFFGEFSQMTVGIWGNAADVVINPYSRAQTALVELVVNLFCDVAIRLPRAFGIASGTPLPLGTEAKEEAPTVKKTSWSPPASAESSPEPVSSAHQVETRNKKGGLNR